MMNSRVRTCALLGSLMISGLLVGACSSSPLKPAELPKLQGQRCTVAASQARPLIVEWSAADRTDLESLVKQGGGVVVKYSGCTMELLRNCRFSSSYNYVASTRQDERVTMRNADELYAQMPLGAMSLEATVNQGNALSVNMSLVGKYMLKDTKVGVEMLEGDECKGATHVVLGLTTGAFEMNTENSSSMGGGLSVAGGKTSSERQSLRRAGNPEACASATPADTRPPEGCGSFVRLELAPVACSLGMEYVEGRGCLSAAEVVAERAKASDQGPSGGGDPADSALGMTILEAARAINDAVQGRPSDPRWNLKLKGRPQEMMEEMRSKAGPGAPINLVMAAVDMAVPLTSSPTGEALEVTAQFVVFPNGQLRWGKTSIRREESPQVYGALDLALESYSGVHKKLVKQIEGGQCALSPKLTRQELLQMKVPEKHATGIADELGLSAPPPDLCAQASKAKGPWQIQETELLLLVGDWKNPVMLTGGLTPLKAKPVIRDVHPEG